MAKFERFYDPEVLARIGRLELRARMVVEGIITGLHKSPYHGTAVEFADHRAYVAGDDPRHIDWKVAWDASSSKSSRRRPTSGLTSSWTVRRACASDTTAG